jgi:hypothetical protein
VGAQKIRMLVEMQALKAVLMRFYVEMRILLEIEAILVYCSKEFRTL